MPLEARASLAPPAPGAQTAQMGRRCGVLGAAFGPYVLTGQPGAALAAEPKVTDRVMFTVRIGFDTPKRPVVIGLFGEEAPVLTKNFLAACTASVPGEAGLYARYGLSTARSLSKDRFVAFADFPGGNNLFKRIAPAKGGMLKEVETPLAGPETKTSETNALRFDRVGRVAMAKGGGTYNFIMSLVEKAPFLDGNNVVIGQVLEGLDVLKDINNVRTSPKGGLLNGLPQKRDPNLPESAEDYLQIPMQKIKIFKSELLDAAAS